MKGKKVETFWNKISLTGCKWSNLNAPMSETPVSHSLLVDSVDSLSPFSASARAEIRVDAWVARQDCTSKPVVFSVNKSANMNWVKCRIKRMIRMRDISVSLMANRPIRRAWCEEGRPRKHQECPTPHLKGKLSAAEGGPFQGGVHQKSSDFRMFLKWVKHPNIQQRSQDQCFHHRENHIIYLNLDIWLLCSQEAGFTQFRPRKHYFRIKERGKGRRINHLATVNVTMQVILIAILVVNHRCDRIWLKLWWTFDLT